MQLLLVVLLAFPAAAGQRKPKDFDLFWDQTRQELSTLPLEARLEPDPAHSDEDAVCFKASYVSLDRVLVHARYCRPAHEGPFPAVLINPWYAQGAIEPPRDLAKKGIAALWFQGRGFEVDRSSYPLENSWYILSGIENPRTYVYRGMVCHALRGVDFLASRPEVDVKRIVVMGSSQGGGLSLLVAGLDKRVFAAAADFPFLSDWGTSLPVATAGPYLEVRKFLAVHPQDKEAALKTVSYFDALYVADRIKVPALVIVGLKDRICPSDGVVTVYGRLASRRKRLVKYPDAGHMDQNAARWQDMVDFLLARLISL